MSLDYAGLKQAWQEWSHRRDLTDSVISNIELMTRNRLGRDLRTDSNTKIIYQDLSTGEGLLDDQVREIQLVKDDAYNIYEFVSPQQFDAKGFNYTYTLYGQEIHCAPGHSNLQITAFCTPDKLTSDTDINDVLAYHPNLYIYSGLVEIFRFIQDQQAMVLYTQQYLDELNKTNEQAQRRRIGDKPVMRAV